MLAGKGFIRAGEGTAKVSYGSKRYSFKKKVLIPPHPLTNFEIQMYYQNKPRFNGVYSRDNLPDKIKDGAYVIMSICNNNNAYVIIILMSILILELIE